jgi:hypothetical protein
LFIPDPDPDFLPISDQGSKRHRFPDPKSGIATLIAGYFHTKSTIDFILNRAVNKRTFLRTVMADNVQVPKEKKTF